ncbi:MAG: hypothetical protein NVSMB52_10530 [Chloroflexota bacterium]
MPRKTRFRNDGNSRGIKVSLDPEILHGLYVEQGLTQASIARKYDCSSQYISLLLAEYGIRRASPPARRTDI